MVRRDRGWRGTDDEVSRLLQAVGRGDQEALGALYDELAPSIFRALSLVTDDRMRAERETLAVFVEVWRRAPTFDGHGRTARSWILSPAHRRMQRGAPRSGAGPAA